VRAKLFRNVCSQAVRLPAESRFEGTEVEVHRNPVSGAVVLTPVRPLASAWLAERDRLLAEPGVRRAGCAREQVLRAISGSMALWPADWIDPAVILIFCWIWTGAVPCWR
jgi:antitoxin VapB